MRWCTLFLCVVLMSGCASQKAVPENPYAEKFQLRFPAQRPSLQAFMQRHPLASQLQALLPAEAQVEMKPIAEYYLKLTADLAFCSMLQDGGAKCKQKITSEEYKVELEKFASDKIPPRLARQTRTLLIQAQQDSLRWVEGLLPNGQQIGRAHTDCFGDGFIQTALGSGSAISEEMILLIANQCYDKTIRPFTWPVAAPETDVIHDVFVVKISTLWFELMQPPAEQKKAKSR